MGQTKFKKGDKFILELGDRQLDEFEIAGTDLYVRISLLKQLTPYTPPEEPDSNTINRIAAIAMAEKIVEEVNSLDCDLEAKKTWARELMNSVLPTD